MANTNSAEKVVLVTGASSGFGRHIAEVMAGAGYRVFGTSRRPDGVTIEGVEMLQLDVCSDESVKRCAETLLARTERIDVLVNNAGFALSGFIEETTMENAQEQFETNFFGTVRVTKAFLAQMRRQRSGRIINIGSLSGLVGVPYRGFYSASKFALEGYSETLAYELANYNIKVSLIEPGFYRTQLGVSSKSGGEAIWDYNEIRDMVHNYFVKGVRKGGNPIDVAKLVLKIARTKEPKLRYRAGDAAFWVPIMKAILPQRLFKDAVVRQFKLKV